jgi:hypothetical protein
MTKRVFEVEQSAKEFCQKLESSEKELNFYKSQAAPNLFRVKELEEATNINQCDSGI